MNNHVISWKYFSKQLPPSTDRYLVVCDDNKVYIETFQKTIETFPAALRDVVKWDFLPHIGD